MSSYAVGLPDGAYWQWRVPCQMACPVGTDAGRYAQLVAQGAYREGYLTARSPNPLASVCGRVCAAPCEDACRRGHFDAPVAIRALKRTVCERFGVESPQPEPLSALQQEKAEPGNKMRGHLPLLVEEMRDYGRGRRVAVVGAGPAGLSCAHDLALIGYAVTLFEASERAGGMAFHGIPEFRLPREVLDGEVRIIRDLGVTIRFQTPLTASYGLAALRAEGFEAVFLAIGVQKGRDLYAPGSELDGIVRAIDYLININNGYQIPSANRVLVIGGGFVAFDAARMALRAVGEPRSVPEVGGGMAPALDAARLAARGGARVTLASLESYAEMPATRTAQGREEFEQAKAEGVSFLPQRAVKAFEGTGRVERVQLIGVRRTYDEKGRFAPIYDENVSEVCEADLVILAIGQQADLSFLTPDDSIELTPARTIRVERETLATSAPGIYAGGDVAFGPRNLIDAIADGKRAARAIDRFLRGGAEEPRFHFRFDKLPTRQFERAPEYDLSPRVAPPTVDVGRRTGVSEVEADYPEAEARRQGERCLACHIQTIYHAERCVLCNRCVDVCPENCLKLIPIEQLGLPAEELEAARLAGAGTSEEPLSAMLKDDTNCIRCGLCAIRCPTDAMTMEVLYYEER
jgi:NADPH-dependent glutamate synthase beta subunit-like oxidoreductase/NAD-dependent dihydropyrimidine dehydrogenase PreA subunit